MSPTGSLLLLLALAGPARAEDAPAPAPPTPAPDAGDEDEGLPEALPQGAALPTAPAVQAVTVPRLYAGANLGASLALAHLGPGITPGLEVGGVLGRNGRFQPFVGVSYNEAHASGKAEDPAFPDGYDWTLAVSAMSIAPGLRVRILSWQERVSPEVAAGPLLQLASVSVGGSGAGAPFPETREQRAEMGGFLSGGIVGRVGPGQLEGHVTFSIVPQGGDLTGTAVIPTLTPSIGYRVSR